MPNDASQRTWGKSVGSIIINKPLNDKQIIVYKQGLNIFVGTMNLDGTGWMPKKLATLLRELHQFSPTKGDIYDGDIIIVATYDDETFYLRCGIDGSNLTFTTIMNYPAKEVYIDNFNNEIRYLRLASGYLWVGTTGLDGSGFTEHQVTARTFGAQIEVTKCGGNLVYFFRSGVILYTAISNLDCTSFVQTSTSKAIQTVGGITTDGSYAYTLYWTQTVISVGKSDGSNFTFADIPLTGYVIYPLFIQDGLLYFPVLDQYFDGSIYIDRIGIGQCTTGLSNFTQDYFDVSSYLNDIEVSINSSGNIYAWTQEKLYTEFALYHLWTYPGNGPITPTTAQCQVTDMLIDATTGKAITPLIGGV